MNGNEVIPFTKKVIKKANEGEYAPTPQEVANLSARPPSDATPKDALDPATAQPAPGGIEAMIERKLNAMIEKKVEAILEKLLK